MQVHTHATHHRLLPRLCSRQSLSVLAVLRDRRRLLARAAGSTMRASLQRQAWDNWAIFHLHWEDAIYRHLPSTGPGVGGMPASWTSSRRSSTAAGCSCGRCTTARRTTVATSRSIASSATRSASSPTRSPAFPRRARGARAGPRARPRAGHDHPARQLPAAVPESGRLAPTEPEDGRCFLLFGRLGRYKGARNWCRACRVARQPGSPDHRRQAGRSDRSSAVPPAVRERITVHDRFRQRGRPSRGVRCRRLRGLALPPRSRPGRCCWRCRSRDR